MYPNRNDRELVEALTKLSTEREFAGFLRDLLTPSEISEFSRRFQIAKLLWTTKMSYLEIAEKVGTSTTTVTRVNQWLFKEPWGGYRIVLLRMFGHPTRKD